MVLPLRPAGPRTRVCPRPHVVYVRALRVREGGISSDGQNQQNQQNSTRRKKRKIYRTGSASSVLPSRLGGIIASRKSLVVGGRAGRECSNELLLPPGGRFCPVLQRLPMPAEPPAEPLLNSAQIVMLRLILLRLADCAVQHGHCRVPADAIVVGKPATRLRNLHAL